MPSCRAIRARPRVPLPDWWATKPGKKRYSANPSIQDLLGFQSEIEYIYWFVYWNVARHDQVVREFSRLGFKTGDVIGIDVGYEERPRLFRL